MVQKLFLKQTKQRQLKPSMCWMTYSVPYTVHHSAAKKTQKHNSCVHPCLKIVPNKYSLRNVFKKLRCPAVLGNHWAFFSKIKLYLCNICVNQFPTEVGTDLTDIWMSDSNRQTKIVVDNTNTFIIISALKNSGKSFAGKNEWGGH